jgi:SAM-dependent methyltransferase
VRQYLTEQYEGVFDEKAVEFHLDNHVGFGFAQGVLPQVTQRVPAGGKVLDIGAGFGAFVIAARRSGLDAVGVEVALFEVEYARHRVAADLPGTDPEAVFHLADGRELPFAASTFDAVTLWNVLEHVPDARHLLAQAARVLKPGGLAYLICPNYAAFRPEAHYRVSWFPLMPRRIARAYLKWRGKNPAFFETSIFYRTNLEVLAALRRTGMKVEIPGDMPRPGRLDMSPELLAKLRQPELILNAKKRAVVKIIKRLHLSGMLHLQYWLVDILRMTQYRLRRTGSLWAFYNPFKNSIVVCARKAIS